MLKALTTAAGMVMLVSSFAIAGQTAPKPVEQPKVTSQSRPSQTTTAQSVKKHHKHHKKHHATTTKK